MSAAAVTQGELFPVLEAKVEKRSDVWKYLKATAQHGALVPPTMVASSLGVSRQRVHQFMEEGRLQYVFVGAKRFVPVRKLEEFLLVARRQGQATEFHVAETYGEFVGRLEKD